MRYQSTLLIIAFFFFSVATVLSTPVALSSRSCTTELPTYQNIVSYDPTSNSTGSNPAQDIFRVYQSSISQVPLAYVHALVHFTNVPSGAYGCQLQLSLSPAAVVYTFGSTQVNVYALPNYDIQPSDSYSTYFPLGGTGSPTSSVAGKGSYLFGTVTIGADTHAVVNSMVCARNVSFLLEIAGESPKGGSVLVRDNGSGSSGFVLIHNC